MTNDVRRALPSADSRAIQECLSHLSVNASEHNTKLLEAMQHADFGTLQRRAEVFETATKVCQELDCNPLKIFQHLTGADDR